VDAPIARALNRVAALHDEIAKELRLAFPLTQEPTGLTPTTQLLFNTDPPTSGDVLIPGSDGWKIVNNHVSGYGQGWVAREGNAYAFVYPAGMVEGRAPGTVYHTITQDALYVRFTLSLSYLFNPGPNGTKVLMLWNGGNDRGGKLFMVIRPDGKLWIYREHPTLPAWYAPSEGPLPTEADLKVEWFTDRLTGEMWWCVNDEEQGRYANVTNGHAFDLISISPTFGGNSGARKTYTDWLKFSDMYVSGR
jgi:hypothetical protein